MGVLFIIHFRFGFSRINPPAIGIQIRRNQPLKSFHCDDDVDDDFIMLMMILYDFKMCDDDFIMCDDDFILLIMIL